MTTITLTNGPDYVDVSGTNLGATWYALKGEDSLNLGDGNNKVYLDWGNDYTSGGYGNDEIHGGDGHDTIYGGEGIDKIYEDNGNDELGDAEAIYGGAGNDDIINPLGTVDAGSGNDYVHTSAYLNTKVKLGTGADTLGNVTFDHHVRTDVSDFKAEDHLNLIAKDASGLGAIWTADILDKLDRNNDGFIGAKDAENVDDDWSVRRRTQRHLRRSASSPLAMFRSNTTSRYVPLEHALTERGFADIVPFYDLAESFRDRHPLSNGWFAPPLTAQGRAKTDTVLERWDDDVSRAHHLQFLAWRRLREEWTFETAPVVGNNRFFIPEVAAILRGNEILLDAGAHHGNVINAFVRHTNGAFQYIIAIEPDAESRTRLQDNLRTWRLADAGVTTLTCALSDNDGEALFHPGLDYASQLSPTGTTHVETRKLDTLDLAPTFVKLHLEGAELAALRGGRQTLVANRPIVAATVYHNADGIWETPLWLMDTLSDYRFLFRLHSWCGTGAVIYAIPKERMRRA